MRDPETQVNMHDGFGIGKVRPWQLNGHRNPPSGSNGTPDPAPAIGSAPPIIGDESVLHRGDGDDVPSLAHIQHPDR
ncbi:MAG: hypothetical protein OXI44_01270 [Bacteroidota bacterium]|nr:hypothetical protein [Bacteroidota bacterium]